MNNLIIIPSRLESSRLPNKPLAEIAGLPMIIHVMNRANQSKCGDVIVATPVGLGTTTRPSVTSTLTGDTVSAITVTSPGTGYTLTAPPEVLIEVPSLKQEDNASVSYQGDFGTIVGVSTTTVGVA